MGGVYLLTQKADHKLPFNQIFHANKPGAVQAIAGDFNNDGWPDIMVLFGSGDEGLWMFLTTIKVDLLQKLFDTSHRFMAQVVFSLKLISDQRRKA